MCSSKLRSVYKQFCKAFVVVEIMFYLRRKFISSQERKATYAYMCNGYFPCLNGKRFIFTEKLQHKARHVYNSFSFETLNIVLLYLHVGIIDNKIQYVWWCRFCATVKIRHRLQHDLSEIENEVQILLGRFQFYNPHIFKNLRNA